MAHHRCSRCKEESYPRHKHRSGGLLCESCLRDIGIRRIGFSLGRVLGNFWGMLVDTFNSAFRTTHTGRGTDRREIVRQVHFKAMETKALGIQVNPLKALPQKR